MKLKNAKVGVRVQMKSKDNQVPEGSLGTITEVLHGEVSVHWDDNVEGWGDVEYDIPSGHGWTVHVSEVRKFKG